MTEDEHLRYAFVVATPCRCSVCRERLFEVLSDALLDVTGEIFSDVFAVLAMP